MILVSAVYTAGFKTSTASSLPERAQMRGAAFNMLSVGLGVGSAWLVGELLAGTLVWITGGFTAILVYLLIESLEYAGVLKAE